jgi:hypothetical protein
METASEYGAGGRNEANGQRRHWTEAERNARREDVRERYPEESIERLADRHRVNPSTIRDDIRAMGIASQPAHRRRKYGPDVARSCEQCGEEFMAKAHVVASGNARFCSRACTASHTHATGKNPGRPRTGRIVECPCGCGRTRYLQAWAIIARRGFFTRSCWGNYRKLHGEAGFRKLIFSRAPGPKRQAWGRVWGGHTPPAPGGRPRGRPPNKPLAREIIDEIRRLHGQGWGRPGLSERFGITQHAVRSVLRSE